MGKIPRYPKIRRLGHKRTKGILDDPDDEIVIQEKVDGSNFRFWREGDTICFGSRRVNHLERKEDNGEWKPVMDYILSKVKPEALREDYVYVGEFFRPHTIEYAWDRVPVFVGYDLLDKETGEVVDYDFAFAEFYRLNIPFVATLYRGKASKISDRLIEELKQRESCYGDTTPEGVVVKNYTKKIFAKSVNSQFLEDFKKKFGDKRQPKMTVERKVVERFITPARVRKVVQRCHEEKGSVGAEDIPQILRETVNDMLEEEILTIVNEMKVKEIDFRKLRKHASKKIMQIVRSEYDFV